MKKSHRWAALAIVLSVTCLLAVAAAQNPAGRSAQPMVGSRVALLDPTFIFKYHTRFNSRMAEMKKDFKEAEEKVKAERDAIANEVKKLEILTKGSPDYQQKERDLMNRQAQLQASVAMTRNEFLQREASIYYEIYGEILEATDYICRQNSIDVVLRFNSEKADPQKPDSVLSLINRQVVWNTSTIDITRPVLDDLNRRGAAAPAAATRPTVPFNNGGYNR